MALYDIATVYKIVDQVLERLKLEKKLSPTLILWDEVPCDLDTAISRVETHAIGSLRSVWEPEGLQNPAYPIAGIPLLSKEQYDAHLYGCGGLYLPVCGLSMMAKIALGIADTPISRMVQIGIMTGKDIMLSPHVDTALPPAYGALFSAYTERIRAFGITILSDTPKNQRGNGYVAPVSISGRKLIDAAYMKDTQETEIVIAPGMVITPLAKDVARQRNITLAYAKEL